MKPRANYTTDTTHCQAMLHRAIEIVTPFNLPNHLPYLPTASIIRETKLKQVNPIHPADSLLL